MFAKEQQTKKSNLQQHDTQLEMRTYEEIYVHLFVVLLDNLLQRLCVSVHETLVLMNDDQRARSDDMRPMRNEKQFLISP